MGIASWFKHLQRELKLNKSFASGIAIIIIRLERLRKIGLVFTPLRVVILNMCFNTEIPKTAQLGWFLRIPHPYNIIVHSKAKIGTGCTIFHGVTIGANDFATDYGAPHIGDYAYLGANSSVIGKLTVGRNSVISIGTIIVRDIPANSFCKGNAVSPNRVNCEEYINRIMHA